MVRDALGSYQQSSCVQVINALRDAAIPRLIAPGSLPEFLGLMHHPDAPVVERRHDLQRTVGRAAIHDNQTSRSEYVCPRQLSTSVPERSLLSGSG